MSGRKGTSKGSEANRLDSGKRCTPASTSTGGRNGDVRPDHVIGATTHIRAERDLNQVATVAMKIEDRGGVVQLCRYRQARQPSRPAGPGCAARDRSPRRAPAADTVHSMTARSTSWRTR